MRVGGVGVGRVGGAAGRGAELGRMGRGRAVKWRGWRDGADRYWEGGGSSHGKITEGEGEGKDDRGRAREGD